MKINEFVIKIGGLLLAAVLFGTMGLSAQTQVPNPGFENWPGDAHSSPKGWHSFDEAGGIFAKTMSNKTGNPAALERVAGHTGKYAVAIRCTKILGVSANGALTTGRVYMGSMSASSAKNYCYTDRENGYAFKFTGRPDSVYFWAKFKTEKSVYATAKAHLHTDCDFKDFVDIGKKTDVASAILHFKDAGRGGWHQYKQAFKAFDKEYTATADKTPIPTVDNWTRRPSYMLFCFSTNRYVMTGSKGDALYIDDIRLIYNKALSSIQIDGVELYGFDKAQTEYVCYVPTAALQGKLPVVTAVTESPRATVEVTQATAENPVAVITVRHDDVYSGEAEPRQYKVIFLDDHSQYFLKLFVNNIVF